MTGMILRTVAEVFVVLALIFGFVKENKVVKVERKAWRFLRKLHRKARDAKARELERELLDARYADEYEPRRSSKTAAKKASGGEKKRKSAHSRVA